MKLLISVLIFFAVNEADASSWDLSRIDQQREDKALYELITKNPDGFDRAYPSSNLEEVDNSLKILKRWLKSLKITLDNLSLFFPSWLPIENREELVERHKIDLNNLMVVLKPKVDELKKKRKTFKPSIMAKCQRRFQRFLSGT